MLTDIALKKLKPKDKSYKVADRDGMYAVVSPAGGITFRFDYRFNARRETLTIGKYAPGNGGISLAEARIKLQNARQALSEGRSPAIEKRREKQRVQTASRFSDAGERYFGHARMAESTRAMRRTIYDRDILPAMKNRLLTEIEPRDLRDLCLAVKDRGAPATAIHVRDIIKQIFVFANLHGAGLTNPADDVAPSSIAQFEVRDRSLSPSEIRIMLSLLERIATLPTIRLGLKLILLTMVRKGELQFGVWPEVQFETAVWSITKERMKRRRPHNVYLSRQSLDIMIALKTCAGNSRFLLPSRYDADEPMSRATFNRVTGAIIELAQKENLPLAPFTVHDLRRTGSTLLNEAGYNSDWIEKCLAHEDTRTSRGVYNKAEYEPYRRHMLQEWANMVDAWAKGERYTHSLLPPASSLPLHDPMMR